MLANSVGIEPTSTSFNKAPQSPDVLGVRGSCCVLRRRGRGQLFFQLSLRLGPKARFELALTGYGPVVLPLHHLGEHDRGTSPVMRLAAWLRENGSNVHFLFQRQAAFH